MTDTSRKDTFDKCKIPEVLKEMSKIKNAKFF